MPPRDVFQTDFRLPARVCILAPGPNGREHHGAIPTDYAVIAVSKAVLIEEAPRKAVWFMNHADQAWFGEANARFRGIRVFSRDALGQARDALQHLEHCYYYEPGPGLLTPETADRVDGAIRYGTTVSGAALQFAYNFGATDILLCGVDMSGDDYWDGTKNVHPFHGETWPAALTINHLIRWLIESRGVRVSTLSATRLEVPAHAPRESS
jgi:hypothetical protein